MFADAALAAGDADPARKPELLADVFVALQEAVAGEASAAIARMAVRRNVEQQGQGLGALVREREQLVGRLKALNEQIAQSFGATGGEAERTQMRGERDTATRRIEAIDARIGKEFPDYHLLVRPQPIQGPEAQALLKEDEAVLIAVPGRFGTHLLALSRERAEWVRSNWTDENIIYAVNRLRYDVGAQVTATPEQAQEWEKERPAGDRPSFDRTTAYHLYTAVFEPVEGVLKNKKRVYVIAGEALAALPFSMLVTAPPAGKDDDPRGVAGDAVARRALCAGPGAVAAGAEAAARSRGRREHGGLCRLRGSFVRGQGDPPGGKEERERGCAGAGGGGRGDAGPDRLWRAARQCRRAAGARAAAWHGARIEGDGGDFRPRGQPHLHPGQCNRGSGAERRPQPGPGADVRDPRPDARRPDGRSERERIVRTGRAGAGADAPARGERGG
jgi:hypothetical protein